MIFVGRNGLHNQLHIGGNPQQIGDDVGRADQQAPLQKNYVCGKALDGGPQILKRISLRHDAKVVFKREHLANAYAVYRLGICKNDAHRPRLDRDVENFAIGGIVQEIHKRLSEG